MRGTGLVVGIAGQRLTGDVGFARSGTELTLVVSNASLTLGDGTTTFATVTVSTGALLITRGGIAGSLVAGITLSPTLSKDLSLDATVVLQENTTAAAVSRTITIGAVTASLVVPMSRRAAPSSRRRSPCG